MNIEAAENEHKKKVTDKISRNKKIWNCPCSGCKKAVKQERIRIIEKIDEIEIDKLNGLGMKILVKEIINE